MIARPVAGARATLGSGFPLAIMTHRFRTDGSAYGSITTTALRIADLTSGRTESLFVASGFGAGSIIVLRGAAHLAISPDDAWVACVMREGLRKIRARLP